MKSSLNNGIATPFGSVDTVNRETATRASSLRLPEITFRFNGFELFLCWHFLILFSGALWAEGGTPLASWVRIPLFLAAGLGFAISALFGKRFATPQAMRVSILLSCIVGCVSTMYLALLRNTEGIDDTGITFLAFALGLSASTLSFHWLHFSALANGRRTCRRIALQMSFGALCSFAILNLDPTSASVIASMLPLLSGLLLIANMKTSPMRPQAHTEAEPENNLVNSARRILIIGTVSSLMLGMAGGVIMGGFTPDTEILLTSTNPTIILGALLAGFLIFLIYDNMPNRTGTAFMLATGIAAFAIGSLLVWPQSDPDFAVVKELLLMFGFNLLDFGLLTFAFHIASICNLRLDITIFSNRTASYLGLASGIIIGLRLFQALGASDDYRFIVAIIACVMTIVIFVITFGNSALWASDTQGNSNQPDGEAQENTEDEAMMRRRWVDCCHKISAERGLSAREQEIFLLLARGRNAEFIGDELYISRHTVKTHISNIYRKLDVHSVQEIITMVEQQRKGGETLTAPHLDETPATPPEPQLSSRQ